jgi:hypothetical protein
MPFHHGTTLFTNNGLGPAAFDGSEHENLVYAAAQTAQVATP